MTTDPRIAPLAEALEYIDVRYQGIFSSASGPGPNDLAAAILAALRAEGWDIVGRDTVIEDEDDPPHGFVQVGALFDAHANLARLRAIEEAARLAVDAKPMDWSIGIDSTRIVLPIDVFDPLMDALDALDDTLRAALEAER